MTPKPPTLGRLLDSILRLRSKRLVACDEAVKRVHERFAEKEAALLSGLDPAMRAKVMAMVEAEEEPAPLEAPKPVVVPDLEPPKTESGIPPALLEPLSKERLAVGRK